MPRTISPPKYSNLLNYIEIKKIGYLEIVSRFFIENLAEGPIEVDARNEVELQTDEKSTTFSAIDKYNFKGSIKEKSIFEISVQILAVFGSRIKPDKPFLKIFEQNTLKVITYPYVRQVVQDLTLKMGIPPLVLPIWKAPPKAKKEYLRPASKD
jgi:preprotein translocase subunit SecB